MGDPVVSYEKRFLCAPRAAGAARSWLRSLPLPGDQTVTDTTVLLANELMTNSIIHSGTAKDITLEVRLGTGTIHVAVTDRGKGEPRVEHAGPEDTGGRGLALVEGMSDRWGYRLDGKTAVWFEIDEDA